MFHMLGRFAFTSSLSRRSSSGVSTGATRFGSCFCESVLLSIFIISYQPIHYSQLKLPPRLLPRPSQHPEPNRSLAMFRITHMGRCLPNHTLSERGESARAGAAIRARMEELRRERAGAGYCDKARVETEPISSGSVPRPQLARTPATTRQAAMRPGSG